MPNFKLTMKINKRLTDVVLVARDIEDARQRAMTMHPTGQIVSIEQKGAGGAVPPPTPAAAPQTTGRGLVRKLVLLAVVAAIATAGYLALRSMGKI